MGQIQLPEWDTDSSMPEDIREEIAACLKKNETLKTLLFVRFEAFQPRGSSLSSPQEFPEPEDASWFLSSLPPNLEKFDFLEAPSKVALNFAIYLPILTSHSDISYLTSQQSPQGALIFCYAF